MSTSFEKAVFQLCKKINKDSKFEEIRNDIKSVIINKKNHTDNFLDYKIYEDQSYVANHFRMQFLGFLLVDESLDEINSKTLFQLKKYNKQERQILEKAYITTIHFIDKCLEDVKNKYPKVSLLLDPYAQYRKPKIESDAQSFLDEEDIEQCAASFKSGKIYNKIISNDALQIIENTDERIISYLATTLKKQFSDEMRGVSPEIKEYIQKIKTSNRIGTEDVLMAYSIFCYTLMSSLETAIQIMYDALIGKTMVVMNNENIIALPNHSSDLIFEKRSVLIQDAIINNTYGGVGSIALLDCDSSKETHIKDFGIMVSITINYANDLGESTKITIITVDDELNKIHLLTNSILDTDLGKASIGFENK